MSGILCVVGARPNYMKAAPILRALAALGQPARLVHTGQHYDFALDGRFFDELQMPKPEVNLEVGSGSHAVQTAEIMRRFEPVLRETRPRCVVVVGDVNSTLACALVAAKEGVEVAHVEAGLRSQDRTMPEEINRILTDQLADLHFVTERSAAANLAREGIDAARVHFTGNVMIDTLLACLPRAVPPEAALRARGYALLTMHRPSNVDDPDVLRRLLGAMAQVAERLPVVFPVQPRAAARIGALPAGQLQLRPPAGYFAMLGLMREAKLVLTDSGGIQEETTALGVPCLTLRENTERPVTVEQGTNTLVGSDPVRILRAVDEVLRTGGKRGARPELWDGHAGERIAAVLVSRYGAR